MSEESVIDQEEDRGETCEKEERNCLTLEDAAAAAS